MKNYNDVMKQIEKRLSSSKNEHSSAGFIKKSEQKPSQSEEDVVGTLAKYIKTLRQTKEEILKNGSV